MEAKETRPVTAMCSAWIARAASCGLVALAVAACSSGPKEPEGTASTKTIRVVTQDQYVNTLAYVFGPDVRPSVNFPPFHRTAGLLALGAAGAGVTEGHVELFQRAALSVARKVVDPEHRQILIPCRPEDPLAADPACATKFLERVGMLLNRRPLPADELQAFVAQANQSSTELKDFYRGVGVALEAILVSPRTLMIVETSEPDPENQGSERLDAYSLASRLSYFLWNSAPDDQLLADAAAGELDTAKGRARVVDRMISSPRLVEGMRAFFDDMLGFDQFATLAKDSTVYPLFTGVTAVQAREQTLKTIVDHLLTQKKSYRNLFTTRETFISPTLAPVYGLPGPPGWERVTLSEDSFRGGMLTQVSFLAAHSHPARSSATLRGKALREIFLCQEVPPPPPNVDFSAVENPDANLHTARERVAVHLKSPACAGCHKIMDPMGLALENFDGSGRFRTAEGGTPIDATGDLDGAPFKDPNGLADALSKHPKLTECLAGRLFSYATGTPTSAKDRPLVSYLDERFNAAGDRLPDLLRVIALSNAFSTVKPARASAPKPAPVVTASTQSGSGSLK